MRYHSEAVCTQLVNAVFHCVPEAVARAVFPVNQIHPFDPGIDEWNVVVRDSPATPDGEMPSVSTSAPDLPHTLAQGRGRA